MTETQAGVANHTDPSRTRTHSWFDPRPLLEQPQSSGIELLRRLGKDLPGPPIGYTLDIDLAEVEEGRAVFVMDPAEFHENPLGTVHGGVLATLLDSATGCALHSTLPAGVAYTTTSLNITYTRPVTQQTGRLRCIGTVLSRGRRTALAEARLVDGRDRLLAHATSSLMIFDIPTP